MLAYKCFQIVSSFYFSLANSIEIKVVMNYIRSLLASKLMIQQQSRALEQSDIGVVTPYKKQCKRIAQACRIKKFSDITIGTAETFQGKEKPVMIISTVRCDRKSLGFVNDPRVSTKFGSTQLEKRFHP